MTILTDKENEGTTQLYLWGTLAPLSISPNKGLGIHADQTPQPIAAPQALGRAASLYP